MNKLIVFACVLGFVLCQRPTGQGPEGRPGPSQGPPKGRGHRGGPPPLPFLKNATEEQRKAFFALLKNDTLTKAEFKTQAASWASAIGGDVQAVFTEFEKNMTTFKAESKANTTALLAKLSDYVSQAQAILDDDSLTRAQEHEKMKAFFDGLDDPKAARVVGALVAGPRGPGGHGPRGPGGPKGGKPFFGGRRGGPKDSTESAPVADADDE